MIMKKHRVLNTRLLTESAYVLRFERNELDFMPGQHIYVGLPGDEDRPYSVYNGKNDPYIEVLIKEIDKGNVSKKLKRLENEAFVSVDEAQGHFAVTERVGDKLVFIATGTGIAPFHSFLKTYPGLDYTMIHGVAYGKEAYDRSDYEISRYILCTSRDHEGDFHGRVTEYLKKIDVAQDAYFFLCGNSSMIDEAYDILMEKGITRERIRTEIYF